MSNSIEMKQISEKKEYKNMQNIPTDAKSIIKKFLPCGCLLIWIL